MYGHGVLSFTVDSKRCTASHGNGYFCEYCMLIYLVMIWAGAGIVQGCCVEFDKHCVQRSASAVGLEPVAQRAHTASYCIRAAACRNQPVELLESLDCQALVRAAWISHRRSVPISAMTLLLLLQLLLLLLLLPGG
jgi:hypothetical protein